MVIDGLSHNEIKKFKQDQAKKKVLTRKKRTGKLSDKTMKQMMKKFDEDHDPNSAVNKDVSIDEHVKMNDNYMRTGWYVPKKK